jgi:hypothetical protein
MSDASVDDAIANSFIIAYNDMYKYYWKTINTGITYGSAYRLHKMMYIFVSMNRNTQRHIEYQIAETCRYLTDHLRAVQLIPSNPDLIRPIGQAATHSLDTIMHLPLSFARVMRYKWCVYVDNGGLCDKRGFGICPHHITFMYTAHNELRSTKLLEDIIRICCNYIIFDYDYEPKCIPAVAKNERQLLFDTQPWVPSGLSRWLQHHVNRPLANSRLKLQK